MLRRETRYSTEFKLFFVVRRGIAQQRAPGHCILPCKIGLLMLIREPYHPFPGGTALFFSVISISLTIDDSKNSEGIAIFVP